MQRRLLLIAFHFLFLGGLTLYIISVLILANTINTEQWVMLLLFSVSLVLCVVSVAGCWFFGKYLPAKYGFDVENEAEMRRKPRVKDVVPPTEMSSPEKKEEKQEGDEKEKKSETNEKEKKSDEKVEKPTETQGVATEEKKKKRFSGGWGQKKEVQEVTEEKEEKTIEIQHANSGEKKKRFSGGWGQKKEVQEVTDESILNDVKKRGSGGSNASSKRGSTKGSEDERLPNVPLRIRVGLVFGVKLEDLVNSDENPSLIPPVVKKCVEFLRLEKNLREEGILRIPGGKQRIESYIKEFDEGKDVVFDKVDPHVVAGILKQYFRELPEPIIPPRNNDEILKVLEMWKQKDTLMAQMGYTEEKLEQEVKVELREVLKGIAPVNAAVFKYLIKFFVEVVQHQEYNKMSLVNVITCTAPSLQCAPGLLKFCIDDYPFFFEGAPIKSSPIVAPPKEQSTKDAPSKKPPPPSSERPNKSESNSNQKEKEDHQEE